MLFNSFQFLIFFPVVVLFYFLIPQRYRWVLLLIASYIFYMCWKIEYIILIIFSTLVDYYCGLAMGRREKRNKRTVYLVISLIANLSVLVGFKYFNFISASLGDLFNILHVSWQTPTLKILLPVGISFYTFQTLSYTIDVYRGQREPERHMGIFAVYVSFFPQLVAGPIERSVHLMPQFYKENHFDYQRVTDGLKLMAWGFFKKVVVADRLAAYVNHVYASPSDYTGLPIWIATYFFAFQIYCDFSGYSDIAIGTAQVMGYSLMENFRRPYFSKSIGEFWSRWHISLSTWFKDYLYIPLGGNRVSKLKTNRNLLIVFLVSGLWHGANWTFVLWGALHGLYLVVSRLTTGIRSRFLAAMGIEKGSFFHKVLQIFITFHLVFFSWIFFRADSISDALILLRNMFIFNEFQVILYPVITRSGFITAVAVILLMEAVQLLQRGGSVRAILAKQPAWIRWPVYYAAVFIVLFLGVLNEQAFIYFQF
ncbi:MBOAT family protein [bacterium]|nr:MBOAT family protein [bacterium]